MNDKIQLYPMSTAPVDGSYILLAGPSGYINTPLRFEAGRWCDDKSRWVTHAGDDFTEGGPEPTHWYPLPVAP